MLTLIRSSGYNEPHGGIVRVGASDARHAGRTRRRPFRLKPLQRVSLIFLALLSAANNTGSITLGGSSAVTQWSDLSGNGNHFTVPTSSSLTGTVTAPVYRPTGNNGAPSVYFSQGAGLKCNNILTLSVTGGWSLLSVARLPDLTSSSRSFTVSFPLALVRLAPKVARASPTASSYTPSA